MDRIAYESNYLFRAAQGTAQPPSASCPVAPCPCSLRRNGNSLNARAGACGASSPATPRVASLREGLDLGSSPTPSAPGSGASTGRLVALQRRVAANADASRACQETSGGGTAIGLRAEASPAATESSAHTGAEHGATHPPHADRVGGNDPPPPLPTTGHTVDIILPGGHVTSAVLPEAAAHAGATIVQPVIGPTLYGLPTAAGDLTHYGRPGWPVEEDMPPSEVAWWESMKDPAPFRLYRDGARGTPPPTVGMPPPLSSLFSCRLRQTTCENIIRAAFSLSHSGRARVRRSRRKSDWRR